MTPQQIAERSAAAMLADDAATKWLGIALVEIGPGRCKMTLEVAAHHLNGHGICHGGFINTLADSAFAFACNSYNKRVVAAQNSISFLSAGQSGETLTAQAVEVSLAGRSGVYDVTVTGQDERIVALFRGLSRQISGQHFEDTQ
jgi:acyl-CoA thioesterase